MKLIFLADTHLRETPPVSRVDDMLNTLSLKWNFIKNQEPDFILIAGDLFHHWKTSPMLLTWALQVLPDNIITVPGNHDLPHHESNLYHKSGMSVLEEAGKIRVLGKNMPELYALDSKTAVYGTGWGVSIPEQQKTPFERNILLSHTFLYKANAPFPGISETQEVRAFMSRVPWADVIVTGDNHQTFHQTLRNRITKKRQFLINPGSLLRLASSQSDHKPCFYVMDTEIGWLEPEMVEIPFIKNHLVNFGAEKDGEKSENEDLLKFIKELEQDGQSELDLNFISNLSRYIRNTELRKRTKKLLMELI